MGSRSSAPAYGGRRLLYFAQRLHSEAGVYHAVLPFILRLVAIAVCGGGGGILAWMIVSASGATGVGGAIAGAMIGMILAALFWAGGIALIRALKLDQ